MLKAAWFVDVIMALTLSYKAKALYGTFQPRQQFPTIEQLIIATATNTHNYFTDKWIMNDAQIDINYFVIERDTQLILIEHPTSRIDLPINRQTYTIKTQLWL